MNTNNIVNKILGIKPKADKRSRNNGINYCDFCGKKSSGKIINYKGSPAFICDKCDDRRQTTEDWEL